MALVQAFIATTRFGLGPRPGELRQVASDPRGWLHAQIKRPWLASGLAALPAPQQQIQNYFALAMEIRQERVALANRTNEMTADQAPGGDKSALATLNQPVREIYLAEALARTQAAVESETPLYERLVAFWSNHFTVSVQRPPIAGLAGAFEREAIRPHVLGRFSDMLLAVTRHPAMLLYLDNARSIGPDSFAAKMHPQFGLNENLGRELLELHTLGVQSGYGQADVLAMAKMLTGWSITPPRLPGGGLYRFAPRLHEPGEKLLLGVRYEENGEAEAERALLDLARHPATAHHLAWQLACHFVADDPPSAAVERLAAVYLQTEGDLAALTRAVIDLPEAWRAPLAKVKQPQDFVVSSLRATGTLPRDAKPIVQSLRLLGQMPFAAPSPAGWPDTAKDWLGPEALMHRIEWARAFADKLGGMAAPQQVVEATIAPVAAPVTLATIAEAGNPTDGLALVLASREFQRR
jgi:uncharacterized protein (DUF1800 family)